MDAQDVQAREEMNLAAMVGDLARRTGLTVATAESLTKGTVAARLGGARGAEEWFTGGIVADSIPARRRALGVHATSLVSEQAAREMATTARTLLGADFCVAVTGGPTCGGPPGMVCFAVVGLDGQLSETRHLPGANPAIASAACAHALTLLRRRLTAHWQRYQAAS